MSLVQPRGTHGARIGQLVEADEATARAKVAAWTGVTLAPMQVARGTTAEPPRREPRVPPVMIRALRAR